MGLCPQRFLLGEMPAPEKKKKWGESWENFRLLCKSDTEWRREISWVDASYMPMQSKEGPASPVRGPCFSGTGLLCSVIGKAPSLARSSPASMPMGFRTQVLHILMAAEAVVSPPTPLIWDGSSACCSQNLDVFEKHWPLSYFVDRLSVWTCFISSCG